MTIKTNTVCRRLTAKLAGNILVIFDSVTDTVEVIAGGKLVKMEPAPKGYTVPDFIRTINKVKDYYAQQN